MKRFFASSARLSCWLLWTTWCLVGFNVAAADGDSYYARVDIDRIGPEALTELKATPGVAWWIEMDRILVVLGDSAALGRLAERRPTEVLKQVPVDPKRLYCLRFDHFREIDTLDGFVIGKGGRYAVIQMRSRPPHSIHDGEHEHSLVFEPFTPNRVLAGQTLNHRGARKRGADPRIQQLVDAVDGQRWYGDVSRLADWNRYSYGDEISAARDWLVSQFQQIEGLAVTTEAFERNGRQLHNVVARIEGSSTPDRWYVIGGHYDSISNNTSQAAPGAEDNASGTAAVLEMARILAAARPQSTIIFMCYSGEEQGLYGSRDHVDRLIADNDTDKIQAVLTMDMIGYTGDEDLDVLLETERRVSWMVELFEQAATDYTDLRSVVSYNPFGSDHMPYLNNNLDALLVIENDYESYPGYHRTNDTIDNVDLAMGTETLKMNVAVMAGLVGIYQPPVVDMSTYLVNWRKRPQPDAPDQVEDGWINVLDLAELLNRAL